MGGGVMVQGCSEGWGGIQGGGKALLRQAKRRCRWNLWEGVWGGGVNGVMWRFFLGLGHKQVCQGAVTLYQRCVSSPGPRAKGFVACITTRDKVLAAATTTPPRRAWNNRSGLKLS